jgi:nucleotide-binding universal stress UspA family protein
MRVLYATDGGQAARDAGRLLDRVARRDDVEVTVMSVADLEGVGSGAELVERQSLAERSRAKASQTVRAATAQLKDAGFVVHERLAEGDPTAEIVKVIEHDPHDIALLGAGNKTWLGRLLHGSTSTQVLHSAPIAVLIVHQTPAEGRVRVIVADDGSDGARLAAQLFIELADPGRCLATVFGVTTLMDLAVVPEVSQWDPASIPTDPVEVAELESRRIADARQRVQRTAGLLTKAGFQADARAVVGNPAEEILKAAHEADFALVVMGSRGLGRVGRALLGSVSDEVRRHSAATLIARSPPSPA